MEELATYYLEPLKHLMVVTAKKHFNLDFQNCHISLKYLQQTTNTSSTWSSTGSENGITEN
jgi:hypothetical protein